MLNIDNFVENFASPRLDYSTGFEFNGSSPSYMFNATTLNPLHREDYMHNLPIYDLDTRGQKMSNPNFIAQYREPSLSPTRHPGYKLMQPEYRPTGFMTERSATQYHIGTPSAITRNDYIDDMALTRGRLGTGERKSRPLHRHQNRYGLRSLSTNDGSDFVHNRGVFNTTFPNVRGHFIIHPDWVSERTTPRN